jgi:hypothetical protein
MLRLLPVVLLALAGLSPVAGAATTTVFSDNFDDGIVSDWIKSSNYPGTTEVTVRSDSFVSPGFSLWTYFDAPPVGSNLVVTATHAFSAPVTADYSLSVSARSAECEGCTMSYDVYLDGVLLDRKFSPLAFENRLFTLSSLSAGGHTLGLGIHSDVAFIGRFSASFDDVTITTAAPIPEPSAYLTMLAGLAPSRCIGKAPS